MSTTAKKRPKGKATRNGGTHLHAAARLFQEPPPGIFPSRGELLQVVAVIAIAASIAVSCHYVATVVRRPPKPFCDSGEEPQGDCEPCPDHGVCHSGRWDCPHGYKKQGRKCVEDTDINKKAEEVFPEADISIDESLKARTGLENDTWFLVHKKALKAAENFLESRTTSDGMKELKCQDSIAEQHKPYICGIRQWISKAFPVLVPLLVLIVGSAWLSWRVHQNQYVSCRAEQVYEQICEILEEKNLTSESMDNEEPWVGYSWLRDHLLLPRERKNAILWKKVEELVQEDCRIDQYPKLIKGEKRIVLQWQVEGSIRSTKTTRATTRRAKSGNHVHMLEGTNPMLPNTL